MELVFRQRRKFFILVVSLSNEFAGEITLRRVFIVWRMSEIGGIYCKYPPQRAAIPTLFQIVYF